MIIIGEKINGTLEDVQKAILERNKDFISHLAKIQTEAGSNFLDVNAGTPPEREPEDLKWLLETVQEAVDTPLCLDSPQPKTLAEVIEYVRSPGLLNSATSEAGKAAAVLKLAQKYDFQVISLTMDDSGIPQSVEKRLEIARQLITDARQIGLKDEDVYIDPLVIAISTDNRAALNFIETVRQVKAQFPKVKTVSGLSNISFGLPLRKNLNMVFLTLALYAGMDAAILDPLDKNMLRTLLATKVMLGEDRFCRNYSTAYRQGQI